jgi:hypothetical protein
MGNDNLSIIFFFIFFNSVKNLQMSCCLFTMTLSAIYFTKGDDIKSLIV